MLSGRGDRGLDCPENLDRGVEGATDHGWLEAAPLAQPDSSCSSDAPYASRIVLGWRRMSPVGQGREKPCQRLDPFRTFLSRARDQMDSSTVQRKKGCDSSVA